MSEKTKQKREPPFSIRFSAAERDRLTRLADRAGQSKSAFIKAQIFGKPPQRSARRVSADGRVLVQILAACAAIADGLSRLERDEGLSPEGLTALAAIRAKFDLLRATVFDAFGRTP
ncbi:MAG: hypothetical protein RIA64_08825 [Rhodospirillales bacterium]